MKINHYALAILIGTTLCLAALVSHAQEQATQPASVMTKKEVYPDRIKKVVAVAPALRRTQLSSEWAKNLPEEIERQLGGFVTARKQLMPEPERWNEFVGKYRAVCMATNDVTDEQARTITCPVLIIGGDRDQFVPLNEFVRAHSLIRNSRLLILPDCDHSSAKRKPIVLREFVLPFLSE